VKFYAPWCRTCAGIKPTFDRVASKSSETYGDRVQFFEVNFKESRELCASQRIVLLPTIHFYLKGFGRVNRFVLTPSNAGPLLRRQLERFLGAEAQMEMLLDLQRGGRDALVRYADLVKALKALKEAPALLTSDDLPKEDSRAFLAVTSDERRLQELEQLFDWLDKDSSKSLDAAELAAATAVARPGTETTDEQRETWQALLDRIAEMADGEGGGGGASLDFAGFVRIMVASELSTYASPEELLPAFQSLDLDAGGTITVDELMGVVDTMCRVMPDPGSSLDDICAQPELLSSTFEAFDLDKSGGIDYEEFVMMVSGRGPDSPY